MSTISAQIDALRRMADGQATYRDARAVMLQAADTIAELQKDLEFANNECEKESIEFLNLQAENAKLREEVEQWHRLTAGIELPEYPITEFKPKDLERENDKLRELAGKAWRAAERLCQAFDGPCKADGVTIYKPCPMGERDEECVYGQLQRDLRELGVGVEE